MTMKVRDFDEFSVLTISHTPLRTLFTPPPLPATKKYIHNHDFQFLLGITGHALTTRKDNGCAKCWRVNKVHYGLC